MRKNTFCDFASPARTGFFLRYVTSSQSASAIPDGVHYLELSNKQSIVRALSIIW